MVESLGMKIEAERIDRNLPWIKIVRG